MRYSADSDEVLHVLMGGYSEALTNVDFALRFSASVPYGTPEGARAREHLDEMDAALEQAADALFAHIETLVNGPKSQ